MTDSPTHCPCVAWGHAHRPGECEEPKPPPSSGATVCVTCRLWHENHHPCPTCGAPVTEVDGKLVYTEAPR